MKTLGWVIIILSFIFSTIIVNKAYQIYMRIMNADMMFFSRKKKLIIIFIVGLIIMGLALKLFGIDKSMLMSN